METSTLAKAWLDDELRNIQEENEQDKTAIPKMLKHTEGLLYGLLGESIVRLHKKYQRDEITKQEYLRRLDNIEWAIRNMEVR